MTREEKADKRARERVKKALGYNPTAEEEREEFESELAFETVAS